MRQRICPKHFHVSKNVACIKESESIQSMPEVLKQDNFTEKYLEKPQLQKRRSQKVDASCKFSAVTCPPSNQESQWSLKKTRVGPWTQCSAAEVTFSFKPISGETTSTSGTRISTWPITFRSEGRGKTTKKATLCEGDDRTWRNHWPRPCAVSVVHFFSIFSTAKANSRPVSSSLCFCAQESRRNACTLCGPCRQKQLPHDVSYLRLHRFVV